MSPSGVSWRPLLATAVGVLAIHLLLLGAAPGPLEVANPLATRPLITRTIPALPAQPTGSTTGAPKVVPAVAATPPRPRAAAPSAGLQPAAAQAPPMPQQPVQAPAPATPLPVAAFTIPGSVRLHYKVTAHRLNQLWEGQAELHWRHDGAQYEAKLEVSALLLPTRVQRSTGRITADGLAPLRFSDKARNEEAAHFERDTGRVIFSSNRPDAPLLPGAQDRLSVLLQLGALIAANPGKFGPDTTIAIQTASTRDAESWLFTVVAEEELQLPGGNVAALKLTRNPRKEFDQKVELWLAPAMDYVPVRLRLTQPNGDWLDQQWSSTDRG